jgi:ABC-type ATPase involved in cell division
MRGHDAGRVVLTFDEAIFDHGGRKLPLEFRLDAGDFLILRADNADAARLVADTAVGLVAPVSGAVRFCGQDWQEMSSFDTDAQRARVGTAFADDALAPHLGMFDNMALRAAFHGDLPPDALREQVHAAMRAFGLPGAPGDSLPIATDRRRAALARAFIGAPTLILIEHSRETMARDVIEALMNSVIDARARDAAVLWLADPRDVAQVELPPDATLRALSARRLELLDPAEPT